MTQVKIFILHTGDCMIGCIESDNNDKYCIYNPMFVHKTEKYGIIFEDVLKFSKDDHIVIEKTNIILSYNPRDSISNFYFRIVNIQDKNKIDINVEKAINDMDEYERQLTNTIAFGKTSNLVH